MVGNVALDVVIGLIFIYLLYSLYATVIMEIISSSFALRARNLRYAIARMLMDEKTHHWSLKSVFRFITSAVRMLGISFNLTYPTLYEKFINRPNIKYLGSGGMRNSPSYISPEDFSKALIESIRIEDPELSVLASIEEGLHRFQLSDEFKRQLELLLIAADNDLEKFKVSIELWYMDSVGRAMSPETKNKILSLVAESGNNPKKFLEDFKIWSEEVEKFALGPETRMQLQSMLDEANNDVVKFRILVEQWYNNTMERASGWFKRSTQLILLFVGSVIVISFNVDTIAIIKKLSTDKSAREQLVQSASSFTKENEALIQTVIRENKQDTASIALKARLDNLYEIRQTLENDIANSQNIISSNWNIPDGISYTLEKSKKKWKDSVEIKSLLGKGTVFMFIHTSVDPAIFKKSLCGEATGKKIGVKTLRYKLSYVFSGGRVWGYLLTVLALSLGAPFWFDLLNKLVKLRSSKSISTESGGGSSASGDSKKTILNRAG